MYADDTTISVSGKTKTEVEANLTQALNETSSWISKNKLILNSDKTKVMLLGSKQKTEIHPKSTIIDKYTWSCIRMRR